MEDTILKSLKKGKTTLYKALYRKGYSVLELGDIPTISSSCFSISTDPVDIAYANGLRNGFKVINFTGHPFLKTCKFKYEMSEEELKWYIDYIEEEDAFRDTFKKEYE